MVKLNQILQTISVIIKIVLSCLFTKIRVSNEISLNLKTKQK